MAIAWALTETYRGGGERESPEDKQEIKFTKRQFILVSCTMKYSLQGHENIYLVEMVPFLSSQLTSSFPTMQLGYVLSQYLWSWNSIPVLL